MFQIPQPNLFKNNSSVQDQKVLGMSLKVGTKKLVDFEKREKFLTSVSLESHIILISD
jgi:hypothetical protein